MPTPIVRDEVQRLLAERAATACATSSSGCSGRS
jgi:hypothetical protein